MKIGVVGAGGRMGRLLVQLCHAKFRSAEAVHSPQFSTVGS